MNVLLFHKFQCSTSNPNYEVTQDINVFSQIESESSITVGRHSGFNTAHKFCSVAVHLNVIIIQNCRVTGLNIKIPTSLA
jgi:hypothetical protein